MHQTIILPSNHEPLESVRDREYEEWIAGHDCADLTKRDLAQDAMLFGYRMGRAHEVHTRSNMAFAACVVAFCAGLLAAIFITIIV